MKRIVEVLLQEDGIPSRGSIMRRFGVTESVAREIRAVVKYLKGYGEEEEDFDFPPPYEEKKNGVYRLVGYARIGILSDVHFPYHDALALKAAVKSLKEYEVDTVILNGDIVDFYSVSFWDRDPSKRNLALERDFVLRAFDRLRSALKDVKFIYKAGNHEARLGKFLSRKVPELWELEELRVDNFLRLKDFGMDYVDEHTRIEAGELDILHGHEYRSFASVNVAITYLRRAFRNVLIGHYHKAQGDTKRDSRGHLHGAWVVGCLCQLNPSYAPYNEWTHGFAFVELQNNGLFSVKNHVIEGGEVF